MQSSETPHIEPIVRPSCKEILNTPRYGQSSAMWQSSHIHSPAIIFQHETP